MQPDFLTVLFKECKKRGIHTALDTSGYASLDKVRPLLTDTDLVLLDIKSFSPEIFKEITGVPIQPVLAFADYLKEQEIPVWIRFVLVPGLSDSEENMQPLAAYLAEFQNIRQVDILPFHKMGEYKWEELGYEYHLTDTKPPDLQELSRVKKIFRDRGLKVP